MKHWMSIVFVFFLHDLIGQMKSTLLEKHRYANGVVKIRFSPSDRKLFESIKTHGLKIERAELINGVAAAKQVVNASLKAFDMNDTSLWMPLFRRNKQKYALVYQLLYNAAGNDKDPGKALKQQNLAHDLLMLLCDQDKYAAIASGLYLLDSTLKSNTKYVYQVSSMVGKQTIILRTFTLETHHNDPEPALCDLQTTCANGRQYLMWNADSVKQDYSGFVLERSEGRDDFHSVNQAPLILMKSKNEPGRKHILFVDSTALNEKVYVYRLRGIDNFGELSSPSNTVQVIKRKGFEGALHFNPPNILNNHRVHLNWRFTNASDSIACDELWILRAEKENGPYVKHSSMKAGNNFVDVPGKTLYYKIYAVGKACDTLKSFSQMAVIVDTIAPPPPVQLLGTCDSLGNILLRWSGVKEKLLGYKIYRKNSEGAEPVQLNNKFVTDTCYKFKVPLNSLTKQLYFSIAATDDNYNTSVLRTFITVQLKDTIAPTKPLLMKAIVRPQSVQLHYFTGADQDLTQVQVVRHDIKSGNSLTLQVNKGDSLFSDTTVLKGSIYSYCIKVMDQTGNANFSNVLNVRYDNGYRGALDSLSGVVDRKQKTIALTWRYEGEDTEKFILYRGKKGGPLTIVKTLYGSERNYSDRNCSIGNTYIYRVKAVHADGSESIISREIELEY